MKKDLEQDIRGTVAAMSDDTVRVWLDMFDLPIPYNANNARQLLIQHLKQNPDRATRVIYD